ncbi:unnamed protein product [Moneuplotes crassus]|uniref:Uncharacterized protein n=1 Tax=Euplotes crassus TaxID=5936 RepID=A0AAD1XGR8_EUPCR|nr:unnamed protein product [Moneuplotes crassus]
MYFFLQSTVIEACQCMLFLVTPIYLDLLSKFLSGLQVFLREEVNAEIRRFLRSLFSFKRIMGICLRGVIGGSTVDLDLEIR